MKNKNILMWFAVVAAIVFCGLIEGFGQQRLYVPCAATTTPAEIKLERSGDIKFITCIGKKVYVNGVELGGGGASFTSQTANKIFASPNGSSGIPAFRSIVAEDIPTLNASKINFGKFDVARLGSGTATANTFLDGAGNWSTITADKITGGITALSGTSRATFLPLFDGETTLSKSFASQGETSFNLFESGDDLRIVADKSAFAKTFTISGDGSTSGFSVDLFTDSIAATAGNVSLGEFTAAPGNSTRFLLSDSAQTITTQANNGWTHTGAFNSSGNAAFTNGTFSIANTIFQVKPTLTGSTGINEAVFTLNGALVGGTATQWGVLETFSTSGTGNNKQQIGHGIYLEEGYAGNKLSTGLYVSNGVNGQNSSIGIQSSVDGGQTTNTLPASIGMYSFAKDAVNQSIGLWGSSTGVTNPSLKHIGVAGFALTGTVNAAGYFSLSTDNNQTTTSFPAALNTAAVIATNGATGASIYSGYNDITKVFEVTGSGAVYSVDGVILKSVGGVCWKISVKDDGVLDTTAATCL